ncbi:MAG: N-acyl-L-amino acid amidohydrolase [Bacteroidetes bacterium GWA2_32_17]|nr:MAG: N-acyl-L-amino acid amidohydrolase [Bacteroidetes bacterium GWA2_32_17]
MEINKIKQIAEKYSNNVLEYRRYLHKHPELSFNEFKTSEYIVDFLNKNQIKFKKGIAKTGILAVIEGSKPGKTIALRADIDALPITEQNNCDYKSENNGVMHACGHDVHTASLMGAILILNEIKSELSGKVLFVFQPAEEKLPGGAKQMLEEGIFNEHKPDFIIAQHVNPSMKAGVIGFKSGMYMASTDEIYMTVKGKGGHAAMPNQITDTVLIASHIIIALQQIVSRKAFATMPTVLSFGKVIANGATNIIPDEVKIEGTFRTMNEEWRKEALSQVKFISQNVAKSMGAECEVNIVNGYPSLINNENVTNKTKTLSEQYLGKQNVIDMDVRMTAEDFSYFAQAYPSTMYRLGTSGKAENTNSPLHSAHFDIDESVLKYSHGLMAWIALNLTKD